MPNPASPPPEKSKPKSHALLANNAVYAATWLDKESTAILLAVARHLSNDDWVAWPCAETLARMTKLSLRTIQRRQERLIKVLVPQDDVSTPRFWKWWAMRKRRLGAASGRRPRVVKFDVAGLEALRAQVELYVSESQSPLRLADAKPRGLYVPLTHKERDEASETQKSRVESKSQRAERALAAAAGEAAGAGTRERARPSEAPAQSAPALAAPGQIEDGDIELARRLLADPTLDAHSRAEMEAFLAQAQGEDFADDPFMAPPVTPPRAQIVQKRGARVAPVRIPEPEEIP